MADIIYINDVKINSIDIIEYPKFSEALSFGGGFRIPDGGDITLDNSRGKFNPAIPGSIFYDRGIYSEFSIYNDIIDRYTFRGKIADINVNHGDNRVIASITSDLFEVSDAPCIYDARHKTPADAIYEILTRPPVLAGEDSITLPYPKKSARGLVSPDMIVKSTFEAAARYQAAKKMFVNIGYYDTEADNNNAECGIVIGELQRFGHCSIYTRGNLICLYQWKMDAIESGYAITPADIIAGSIKWNYSQDDEYQVRGSYRIAYENNNSVLWAIGKNPDVLARYKCKNFGIPDQDVESSDSADHSIIYDNYNGAKNSGGLALYRFDRPTKIFQFSVPYRLETIQLGWLLTMQVSPYTGWNCIVVGREVEKAANKIELTCIVRQS